jgi:tetratricopeptide (TPR) repeat protein
VGTEDQTKPTVEQKPPDPEQIIKDYFRALLRRTFGPRGAFIILVIIAAWGFHSGIGEVVSEMGEVVSDLNAQVVQWWPLPKAKPDVFTVAVARLEDDEKADMEMTIARDLRDLGKSNGIAVLEFPRVISDEDPPAGHAMARKWLNESGAQILIWGRVLVVPGRPAVPQLYWTNSEGSSERNESGRYGLDENLRLPPVFQIDLSEILRLLVVTQSCAFHAEEGDFVADRLRPFIERVSRLLEGDAAKKWTAENIARTEVILGGALSTVGEQSGDNVAVSEAIDLNKGALTGFTRQQYPLDWAQTQNDLGAALSELGERETGTQHLTEAVAAYRAALEERTRARLPLYWAQTQNNLGATLARLGEREPGIADFQEAVAALRAALQERTRERVPLDWAQTQNNLGLALADVGERESGTPSKHLTERAITAYRAALEEWTRARVPLDWAIAQNNLGDALADLGQRETGTQHLTEAVATFNAVLEVRTQARVPLDWAMTQHNLGTALLTIGERETGTQHLTEAVAAYRAALEERTRARVPLYWAMTENNLGLALADLGTRTHDINELCQAVADHVSAWQVFSEAVPYYYAPTAVENAKTDVAAIHLQSRGAAPPCLQTYSAPLNRMGVPN